MWKTSTEISYFTGGNVATVWHEYVSEPGETPGYYEPVFKRRVFVERKIAIEWIKRELDQFDPTAHQEEEDRFRNLAQGVVGPAGEA